MQNLINDKNIIKMYKYVEDYENKDPKAMGYHDYTHIVNVTNTMTSIMKQLNISKEEIDDFTVAAILHDIGAYCGKKDHHIRSYHMAKKYIEDNNIILNDKNRVLNAIYNHSFGFNQEDLLSVILIFADKMDMTKTRVAPAGKLNEGMNQFSFVENININITSNELQVHFIVNELCDKQKMEEYYFIDKMLHSVNELAKRLNLQPKILYNENPWLENKKINILSI